MIDKNHQSSTGFSLPEQRFKHDILNAQTELIFAEQVLVKNKRLNNGLVNQNDLAEFESRLVVLFSYIKNLVKDQGELTKDDIMSLRMLEFLESGRVKYPFHTMQGLKNFLLAKIYKIGITNILRRRNTKNDEFFG